MDETQARVSAIRVAGPSEVPRLLQYLEDDPEEEVRVAAAGALARLRCLDARKALLRALESDTSSRVRNQVVWSLGEMGETEDLLALCALARDGGVPGSTAETVLRNLARKRDLAPVFVSALASVPAEQRLDAAWGAGVYSDATSTPQALRAAFEAPEPGAEAGGVTVALLRCCDWAKTEAAAALDQWLLDTCTRDPQPFWRRLALVAGLRNGFDWTAEGPARAELALAALDDDEPEVAKSAARAVEWHLAHRPETVRSAVLAGQTPGARRVIARLAVRGGGAEVEAAFATARRHDPSLVDWLLEGDDWQQALGLLAREGGFDRAMAESLLTDPSPERRGLGAERLAELLGSEATPALLEALTRDELWRGRAYGWVPDEYPDDMDVDLALPTPWDEAFDAVLDVLVRVADVRALPVLLARRSPWVMRVAERLGSAARRELQRLATEASDPEVRHSAAGDLDPDRRRAPVLTSGFKPRAERSAGRRHVRVDGLSGSLLSERVAAHVELFSLRGVWGTGKSTWAMGAGGMGEVFRAWYDRLSIGARVSIVTVSPKFQIVIPKDIRKSLGLRPGQKAEVFASVTEGRIEIVPRRPMKELRGFLKGMDPSFDRDKMQGRERV